MKKRIFIIASASVLSMAAVYAATPVASAWSQHNVCHEHRCSGVRLDTLDLNGDSDIRHSTIKDKAVIRGHATIEHSSFGSLTVYGHTEIDNIQVAGNTLLHGHTDIEDSQLHQLMVYGHTVVEDSEFAGPVTLYGNARFEDSNLARALTVYGQKLVLDDSKTQSIKVHASNHTSPVCIFLTGKSAVNGDITVTGGNRSQIYLIKSLRATLGGKITGATIVSRAPKGC